jgi:hypothetical protein
LELLPLDDSRWATYRGGYNRAPYDVVPLIRRLHREGTSDMFWELVWDELHHQGDVGEASYALVPYVVEHLSRQRELDDQVFHYCVAVDLAQPENKNPPIPRELEFSYAMALRKLPVIGSQLLRRGCREAAVMGIAAATALAAGHRVLARAYIDFGRADALEYLHGLNGFEPGQAAD